MGIAFLYGNGEGGASLNFKIVGGTTAPENPKENTIWVNTETDISSYSFSSTEPENPVDGLVWFFIGVSSAYAFSITKKDPIMVYPISAKQYISGVYVDVEAKSYQNGEWVDWLFMIVNKGAFTPGYEFSTHFGEGTVENKSGRVCFKIEDNQYTTMYCDRQIDVSKCTSAEIVVAGGKTKYPLRFGFATNKKTYGYEPDNVFDVSSVTLDASDWNVVPGSYIIDLTAINSTLWFGCQIAGTSEMDDVNYAHGGVDVVDIILY